MLHSGSRGVGNAIGSYFIELAKQDMRRHFINLPDQDLAYLAEGTEHYNDYVQAVSWAQKFARMNREVLMQNLIGAVRTIITQPFETPLEAINFPHHPGQKGTPLGQGLLSSPKGPGRGPRGAV